MILTETQKQEIIDKFSEEGFSVDLNVPEFRMVRKLDLENQTCYLFFIPEPSFWFEFRSYPKVEKKQVNMIKLECVLSENIGLACLECAQLINKSVEMGERFYELNKPQEQYGRRIF